jgi:ubiquinone/menaquinone biosynthesis C-methylase UbiE
MKKNRDQEISNREIADIYDELFTSPGALRDSDRYYQWALEKLELCPGERLLDVACGAGLLLMFAQQKGVQAHGIDLSMGGLSLSKQLVGSGNLALADGEFLPFANYQFDIITNLGSLEHFLNPIRGLEEMRRLLRDEGRAAIFLPNSYYLVDIIWQVWRTGYSVSHNQPVERFATFREWWDLIESVGFKVERAYKYNFLFPRTINDWRWYKQNPRKLLNLIVSPFIPLNLSNHFLYVCRVR